MAILTNNTTRLDLNTYVKIKKNFSSLNKKLTPSFILFNYNIKDLIKESPFFKKKKNKKIYKI